MKTVTALVVALVAWLVSMKLIFILGYKLSSGIIMYLAVPVSMVIGVIVFLKKNGARRSEIEVAMRDKKSRRVRLFSRSLNAFFLAIPGFNLFAGLIFFPQAFAHILANSDNATKDFFKLFVLGAVWLGAYSLAFFSEFGYSLMISIPIIQFIIAIELLKSVETEYEYD